MLLQLIIKILKPSNDLLKKRKKHRFARIQIWLYKCVLKQLSKTYAYYAISDQIIISRHISVIHEYRDLEFEEELRRNKIDITPKLRLTIDRQFLNKKCAQRPFYLFKFKDVLIINTNERKIEINRSQESLIDSSEKLKVKTSSDGDIIKRSIIEVVGEIDKTNRQINRVETSKSSTTTKNMFGNAPTDSVFHEDEIDSMHMDDKEKEVLLIDKKGFQIDTSF